MRDEGPFDGVIAFSQGTSLAAAYLIQNRLDKLTQITAPHSAQAPDHPFSCAVFFSGRMPYLDAGLDEADRSEGDSPTRSDYRSPQQHAQLGPSELVCPPPSHMAELLRDLPSVHVWGERDLKEPGQGRKMYDLFASAGKARAVVHEGGHSVPGSRSPAAVYESARCIREMISQIVYGSIPT